jgi:hypothetical protein
MPTYTLTAEFHIEADFDEFLSHEENYENLMIHIGNSLQNPALGINLIKVTEIEAD